MNNWLIFTKLIVLVYCVAKYSLNDNSDIVFVLLTLLIYICLTMFNYIIKNNLFKNVTLLAATILLIASAVYLCPLFVLMLPLNIIELTERLNIKFWISSFIMVLILFTLNANIIPEYILVTLVSCQFYIFTAKIYLRSEKILHDNDLLREKNDLLSRKLNKDFEYGIQLKHLSQLEERNKIAQEIHDRVGHSISGSIMLLEAAKLLLDRDRIKAEGMLQSVIEKLREGMESIRATLRNIKPAAEQMGINRIKLLLDEYSRNNQIKANIFFKGEMNVISYEYWKIIEDNVKEALTNSLKYAKATTISLNIDVLNKYVKVEVKDNGIGALKVVKGLGIAGIEERCTNVGGKVIIDGSKGFSIITLLPLVEVNNAN